jgi:hypothetical protein
MLNYYQEIARRFSKESERYKRRKAFINGIERLLKKSPELSPIIIKDVKSRGLTSGFLEEGFYHVVIGKYKEGAYFYGGGGPNEPPLWLRFFKEGGMALYRIYEEWPKKPIDVLLASLRHDSSNQPAIKVFNGILKDFSKYQGRHGGL